jgi:hypothetical protein
MDSITYLNAKNNLTQLSLDQATRDLPGSPDIVDSIFRKIDKSSIFIADITPITTNNHKGIPNPNVLIELGYAANTLGWDNIICICNTAQGKVESLPFDIKQRRITYYSLDKTSQKEKQIEKLTNILKIAIPSIQENQATYDKVTEIFKIQLDHILLSILNHFNSLFEIKTSLIGIDVFYSTLKNLSNNPVKINTKITVKSTTAFLALKIKELSKLTKHPLLILNKKINQITSIISLIESLTLLRQNIISDRFYNSSLKKGSKTGIQEGEILNLLLSDIASNINDILDTWGAHLLIDPSII